MVWPETVQWNGNDPWAVAVTSAFPPGEIAPHEGNAPASGWMLWVIESPLCIRTTLPTWTVPEAAPKADIPLVAAFDTMLMVTFAVPPPPAFLSLQPPDRT